MSTLAVPDSHTSPAPISEDLEAVPEIDEAERDTEEFAEDMAAHEAEEETTTAVSNNRSTPAPTAEQIESHAENDLSETTNTVSAISHLNPEEVAAEKTEEGTTATESSNRSTIPTTRQTEGTLSTVTPTILITTTRGNEGASDPSATHLDDIDNKDKEICKGMYEDGEFTPYGALAITTAIYCWFWSI
ncbi:hypothetical protein VTL71DRAFT_9446 [Oculimacula yallundae]|uniref:Uncharacterized protein n=1 Tax=Oculimacula yallundae TaxID=86028 RepID=A0ABR4BRY3_9HELO